MKRIFTRPVIAALVVIGIVAVVAVLVQRNSGTKGGLTSLLQAGGAGTCLPNDGVWARDGQLAGPCCTPPDYQIQDPRYKTCQNFGDEMDSSKKNCLANCCKYCKKNAPFYDSSWEPMCQCACSLCCNNADEPHFAKYGTCVHYISGDPAEAETPDSQAASKSDWRGWIDFNM